MIRSVRARTFILLPLLTFVLLGASTARAGDDTAKKAREAFAEGQNFFNLAQWDKAIDAWQKGYQLKPDPVFLFNIAQAYRQAQNYDRALFFYRSYLRNSPDAPNRAAVERWIETSQRGLDDQRRAKAAADAAAAKEATERAERERQDRRERERESERERGTLQLGAAGPAAPAPPRQRRIDLSIAGGIDAWVGSMPTPLAVNGGAGYIGTQVVFSGAVAGGYTFFERGRLQLRAGLRFGYSFLPDQRRNGALSRCNVPALMPLVVCSSTDHLISIDAEPTLIVRLFRDKLYGFVNIGIGALVFAGVENGSFWLARPLNVGTVSITRAAFELRPSVGLAYRIVPLLSVFVLPGVVYSPRPTDFDAPGAGDLVRFEAQLGVMFHF
jgi:hypothetical protein